MLKTALTQKVCFFLILCTNILSAQIGIGTTNPDNSSILHLNNTSGSSKGLIVPRINGTTPLISPSAGIVFYDSNTNSLMVSKSTSSEWENLSTGQRIPKTNGTQPAVSGVGIGTTSIDPNAVLEISSTNKGVLLPIADSDPTGSIGMLYYNSTINKIKVYGSDGWTTLNSY